MYNLKTKDCKCYMWHECIVKWGTWKIGYIFKAIALNAAREKDQQQQTLPETPKNWTENYEYKGPMKFTERKSGY